MGMKGGPRSAEPYFDFVRFMHDVNQYRFRHNINVKDLATEADVGFNSMSRTLRLEDNPCLATVCMLAEICDLSIDKYRKTLVK